MLHTSYSADHRKYSRRVRTLCGLAVPHSMATAGAARTLPTCPDCLVLRDAYIEFSGKPLTIRRARDMFRQNPQLNAIKKGPY